MIKVVTINKTMGNKKFIKFLDKPFNINMLYPNSIEILFEGWNGENMINYHKFTNENNIILEFYPKYYTIKKDAKDSIIYKLPIPKTINDFINDMDRFGIQLYWTKWIDENFEPKDYLHVDEIKDYFIDLLKKLDKSNELL